MSGKILELLSKKTLTKLQDSLKCDICKKMMNQFDFLFAEILTS